MSFSVVISASPSDLTLSEGNGYLIASDGFGSVGQTWRLGYATSPWVHGSILVAATLDQGSLPLGVLVTGSSEAQVRSRLGDLTDALSQFTYTVTVTVGGSSDVWTADPADWSLAEQRWDGALLAAFWQRINVNIPVHPVSG